MLAGVSDRSGQIILTLASDARAKTPSISVHPVAHDR